MQLPLTHLLLQTPTDVAEVTEVDVNVLQLLMEGGWYIMLPLALMSLIGMYVFLNGFWPFEKRTKSAPTS